MRRVWLAALLPLVACSLVTRPGAAPANPRFDWFAYEGDDPVYHTIAPRSSQYLNPILEGFYPDPSITRAGDDFYLVNSSFSFYPGIPIWRSRDLVHWTQIGHVLDRPSQLALDSLDISQGVFAPTIRYHAGTFYVVNTLVGGGGNFLVTATNPAGPWSDPVWLRGVDGIDPSLFFDDDGKAYVVNNGPPIGTPLYEGHRAIWIQEYDTAARRMVGPRTLIVNGGVDISAKPIWIEGPHLFRVGGKYVLICAEGGTGDQHSEVVFRSDSARGPYVPYAGNPILTQRQLDPGRPFPITSTGHADMVELPNGDWWAVFLGARPYEDDSYNTGRETFLMPVRWVDGWPVITAGDEVVPYVHERPALPASPAGPVPTAGNFVERDEFDSTALAPRWNLVRTPRERWYDLATAPGWLTLRARAAALDERAQPSFIGRRQQHAWASASTAMIYVPQRAGDEAGLAAYQNEEHYLALTVALEEGQPVVQLEEHAGEATDGGEVLAFAPVHLSTDAPLYLKIRARGASYDFFYGYTPGEWVLLKGDVDGRILSTRKAGGFVGTYLGMYAHSPPR